MSKGLTNAYLEKITSIFINKNFVGVFPCNIHIKPNKKNFSIIFNTGEYNTDGEHFVAIKFFTDKIIYFDSFGEKPTNKNILKFINTNKKNRRILWNSTKIQDDSSSFCGFYCLAFLLSVKRKMPFNRFINLFSIQNKKENDVKVIKFITK